MALTMPWPHRTLKRQLQHARELPQVLGTLRLQTVRICEPCSHLLAVWQLWLCCWMHRQPAQERPAMLSCGSYGVIA